MRETIKNSLKTLIENRYHFVLVIVMFVLSLVLAIILSVNIHSSELQLISRYSSFGITHLYRNQWYYLFVFVFFELMVFLIHASISVKILVVKGRSLAATYLWLGFGVLFLGFVVANSVLNVWIPL